MQRPSLAVLCAVLGLFSISLQGCSPNFLREKPGKSPLEVCPAFKFKDNGYVAESRAGELVHITCPTDYMYDGPPIQCSWVDKFCVAYEQKDVSPDFCWNQYNLTLQGHGLMTWPEGVLPNFVRLPTSGNLPTGAGGNLSNISLDPNATKFTVGRRLENDRLSILPTIITPDHLVCDDERYTKLDFAMTKIAHSNLGGYGPDSGQPGNLRYERIAHVSGQELDLIVTTEGGYSAGKPDRNGKGSSFGRININSTSTVLLKFRFVKSQTQEPMTLKKVFFTLFDVHGNNDGNDLEITVSGISEYFVTAQTRVAIKNLSHSQYTFGEVPVATNFSVKANNDDSAQESVKDMWLNSLNRTVVLMFRNTSEFTLIMKVNPTYTGRDFEFTGRSEVVDIGRKFMCQTDNTVEKIEAKFSLAEPVEIQSNSWILSVTIGVAFAAITGIAVVALGRRMRCQPGARYNVLLSM